MKQTQNLLMTTMSTSRFNISESSPSKVSKKKSRTPNLTPNRDLDKSRSITYRSNSNFIDLSHSPSISTIRRSDTNLYERLHNQAKEFKEKIDHKKNEYLEHIKKEAIPKIHEVSKKIERKRELFPERLYPYHKLNKLDTEEDNSFEYAHVATVRSNPLGISGEFDNDDFRNNIDSIFCDDEEIKNLYGNKPSFVKIYRGIKHPKRDKFPFKPTLSKNTDKIVKNMELGAQPLKKSKSSSIDESSLGLAQRRKTVQGFKSFLGTGSDGAIHIQFERENIANNPSNCAAEDNREIVNGQNSANAAIAGNWSRNTISAMPYNAASAAAAKFVLKKNSKFSNSSSGNGNLINIDFIYENDGESNAKENSNFNDNVSDNNFYVNYPSNVNINNSSNFANMNSNNSYVNLNNNNNNNNFNNINNNNPILVSAAYARNNSSDTGYNNGIKNNNNNNNNFALNNSDNKNNNLNINANNNQNFNASNDLNSNTDNLKQVKKATPSYFDNPTERIKSRYEMELKKSYTSNYYNINKVKTEKINPKSINISNKLYSQGINFMKKKEKITEEKRKADLEEFKKHSFKPNLNSTSSTAFVNTNNNTNNNLINYNSSNSSVNFASNNLSGFAKRNSNNELSRSNNNNKNSSCKNNNNLIESQTGFNHNHNAVVNVNCNRNEKKTSSISKANMNTNNSKNSAFTQGTNKTASTNYTKINPTSAAFYTRNTNANNRFSNNNNNNKNNIYNNNNDNSPNRSSKNDNFYTSKKIRNFNYSCEEYKTPNSVNNLSSNIPSNNHTQNFNLPNNNNDNNSLLQTPGRDGSLSRSVSGSFYERSRKWKEGKEQKAEKQREEKTKEELGKCSFSPKLIPKSKNFFEEKFGNNSSSINRKDNGSFNNSNISYFNNNNNNNIIKNDYVTRMLNVYNKKAQEKNFQSKIFGENVKNLKMKITQPQEFNFSQLVSRKCRENFNKARVLHRAESVKNYREKLSTKIFFNQAVFEIEDNSDLNCGNNLGQASNITIAGSSLNNSVIGSSAKRVDKSNRIVIGAESKNNINNNSTSMGQQQHLVNKNMNINLNVNIMMNK